MYKKKYHIYFPPFLHSPYSAQQAPSTSCIFFNHPLDPVSIAHICMDGQSLPLYHDYSTGDCVRKKKKKKKLLIPFLLEDLNCQELLSIE